MPMVDSLRKKTAFDEILANLGGALEWDCSPETESRTVVHPFSTTPASKEINEVINSVGVAMRMQIGCLSEICAAYIALYPTNVGYCGYAHRQIYLHGHP